MNSRPAVAVRKLAKDMKRIAEDIAQVHNNFYLLGPVHVRLRKAHDELLAIALRRESRGRKQGPIAPGDGEKGRGEKEVKELWKENLD